MAVWFIGYTPDLATASMIAGANSQGHWVSLNGQTVGGSYITRAAGSTNAGPMWGDAMKVIQQWLPDRDFTSPDPRTIKGKMVTVPSVYGYSPEEAAKVLREAGLSPVIGPMVNSGNSYGTVAYLDPGSGSEVGSGSTVTIYVSNGTPYVEPEPSPKPGDGGGRGGRDGGGPGGGDGGGDGGGNGGFGGRGDGD
jgi:membrane peptidoglycan carboxypeptidase